MDDTLNSNKERGAWWVRWNKHLAQDVEKAWADIILIIACFISGLVDSAVFNVWSCFVSMQTGNTVYVGLGVSGQPLSQPYRWVKSSTAILSFCLGTFVFSRLARFLGPLRRGTLCGSFLFQALLCFASGGMVISGLMPEGAGDEIHKDYIVLLPLSLLSFQSAGQVVASRMLSYKEIPTVVLTSTYCDLLLDAALFTAPLAENPKRNRRVISAIALLAGAMLGGVLTRSGNIADALWIAGSIKVAVAVVWVFWREKRTIHLE